MTYTLHLGDCLDILPTLEPGSIDAVITDPPYGVGLKQKAAKQRGGGVTIRLAKYDHPDTLEYIQQVVIPAIELCRKIARVVVVTPGTRNLWLYPPADDIGCFYSAAGTGRGKWGFTCMQPILYYGTDPYYAAQLGGRPNSMGQTYPNDANQQAHPCAKPLRMMQWLVERCAFPGQTILDPFMGSATTGVAALMRGCNFIGIEINPDFYRAAEQRLDNASGKQYSPLVTERATGQLSLFDSR